MSRLLIYAWTNALTGCWLSKLLGLSCCILLASSLLLLSKRRCANSILLSNSSWGLITCLSIWGLCCLTRLSRCGSSSRDCILVIRYQWSNLLRWSWLIIILVSLLSNEWCLRSNLSLSIPWSLLSNSLILLSCSILIIDRGCLTLSLLAYLSSSWNDEPLILLGLLGLLSLLSLLSCLCTSWNNKSLVLLILLSCKLRIWILGLCLISLLRKRRWWWRTWRKGTCILLSISKLTWGRSWWY